MEEMERLIGPFPYDIGADDGPVLLNSITVRKSDGAIISIDTNPLGSFGRGWPTLST
jgi:hypothetical protein